MFSCRACIVYDDRLYVMGGQEGDFMAKPGSPIFKCSRRNEVRSSWFLMYLCWINHYWLLRSIITGCLNNNPVFMLVFRALVIVKFKKFFIWLAAYKFNFLDVLRHASVGLLKIYDCVPKNMINL